MVPVQFLTPALAPEDVEKQVLQALAAGCRWMTLRFSDETTDTAAEPAARRIVATCRKQGVIVLTDGRAELCRTIGADGVHLGDGSVSPVQARETLGGEHGHAAIVGCNAAADAETLVTLGKQGADYAIVNATPDEYQQLCNEISKSGVRLPLCAEVSGAANVMSLLETGVQGIATSDVHLLNALLAADETD